jgi:hypothetical protein
MNTVNELIDQLIEVRDSLFEKINDSNLPMPVREAALTEHDEVCHRLRVLLATALKTEVSELAVSLEKVRDAKEELADVLKTADKAAAVTKGVARFLTVVDKLLDQVKVAAAAVG